MLHVDRVLRLHRSNVGLKRSGTRTSGLVLTLFFIHLVFCSCVFWPRGSGIFNNSVMGGGQNGSLVVRSPLLHPRAEPGSLWSKQTHKSSADNQARAYKLFCLMHVGHVSCNLRGFHTSWKAGDFFLKRKVLENEFGP